MAVITLSRQFGAGGLTLGQMLAEKLGYTLVDNEIIQMVAENARVSTDWVESIEKEAGGRFLNFVSGLVPKRLIDQVLDVNRGYIDEEIYVDLLHKIITKIAKEGDSITLGRGGQYILAGQPDVYHILLVAAKADRVKFIEKKYKLSDRQAAQWVTSQDKRRVNLYRKFHQVDYDQPDHYHLVLNMSLLDFEKGLDLICRLVASLIGSNELNLPVISYQPGGVAWH